MDEDETVGPYARFRAGAWWRDRCQLPTAASWNDSFPVAGNLGRGHADVDVHEHAGDCSSVGEVFCSVRTFDC